jgi:hypothetical protein
MKLDPIPQTIVSPATLQDVIDRLAGNGSLSATRKRDLRSAVVTFGKLVDKTPALIPLDLADIRATLDAMVPAQAKVSAKRWANLRSDLAAAIEASGLRPMLKTKAIKLDASWSSLLQPVTDQRVRNGLSRLARWASRYQIAPAMVDDAVIERFIAQSGGGKPGPGHSRFAPWRRGQLERPCSSAAGTRLANGPCAEQQAGAKAGVVERAAGLLPSGRRSLSRLGRHAGPPRREGAGKRARPAHAAFAARPHPLGGDRGCRRRGRGQGSDLAGKPGRNRDFQGAAATSLES